MTLSHFPGESTVEWMMGYLEMIEEIIGMMRNWIWVLGWLPESEDVTNEGKESKEQDGEEEGGIAKSNAGHALISYNVNFIEKN